MNFSPDSIYHIYNRGNDKQLIFLLEENYSFFLNKIKQDLLRLCDILAYCLMPNHFHLLLREKIDGGIFSFLRKMIQRPLSGREQNKDNAVHTKNQRMSV